MFYKKFILYYYIFITLLALLAPTNVGFSYFIPGIILLWIMFFTFSGLLSRKQIGNKEVIKQQSKSILNRKNLILLTLFSIIFIPIFIKFYTGQSPTVALHSFFSGSNFGKDSNYSKYQQYFADNNIGTFSLKKLPLIFGYGIIKFLFILYCLKIISYTKKIRLFDILCLTTLIFLYFLVGVSRGTSFENFEILMILFFSMILRSKYLYGKDWLYGKGKILMYSLVIIGAIYFIISKSLRFEGNVIFTNTTSTLKYNPESFIAQNFPLIALITNNLTGYFLFGLYFISSVVQYIWLNGTLEGILVCILPNGPSLFDLGNNYYLVMQEKYIDCGAAWIPDLMNLSFILGFPITLFVIYILGRYSIKLYYRSINGSTLSAALLFYITYLMFSFPTGNFLTASSATQISLLLLITFISSKRIRRKF